MEKNYKFDTTYIAERTQEMASNLKTKGRSNLAGFAAKVISDRLKQNPMQYLEFGVYWWSVKNALREAGYDFGSDANEALATAYVGETQAETFVMGEEFKDFYRQKWFVGNNSFDLDDGSTYFLFDENMETLA